MIIDKITVRNFRCLHKTLTPLSDFTTIIGENNSGKSSLLEALIIFFKGTKLSPQDYYDLNKEIVITVDFQGVTEEILKSIVPEHKDRIVELVKDQCLTLIRRYSIDGSSNIRCVRAIPIEQRFKPEFIDQIFKGKRGNQIRDVLNNTYPELADQLDNETQTRAKELISSYILTLPGNKFQDEESPLPIGIDAGIKNLFPEPVYIPAVKDLTDDIKTKESTSFGQLLKILLNVIENQLVDAEETFASLNKKLNPILKPDGNYEDERLHEIKEIEQSVEQFVQENFPSTNIKFLIPPPEIKTILSSARILVNDGVEGDVDTKGDGLKRAVTFAILRTYVTFAAKPDWQKDVGRTSPKDRYIFLFEEPELYLHPTAQRILFNALKQISQTHQMIISTHSPIFLSPETMGTFIKMVKQVNDNDIPPCSKALPINLDNLSTRDQFQLICYDNNNAAFFSERVVFVEGDSDQIFFPHIAKILNPKWDFKYSKVAIVRVNGKGSIERYRRFFEKFNVRTFVISDLDVIVRDFDKLGLNEEANLRRQELLKFTDELLAKEKLENEPNSKRIKKIVRRFGWREQWSLAKEYISKVRKGEKLTEEEIVLLDRLFEPELEEPRLKILKSHPDIQSTKTSLISDLYNQGIFILNKGSVEDYYPQEVNGRDKPSKAQDYCRKVTCKEPIYELCQMYLEKGSGNRYSEFEAFFSRIFDGIVTTESDNILLESNLEIHP